MNQVPIQQARINALLARLRAVQGIILASQPPPQASSTSVPYTGRTV